MKKSATDFRDSEGEQVRKLSRAVEQSPVSVVITDTSGRIEYVNPKFCEVTGYSADEAIGANPRILKSGELPREHYQHMWSTITSGKEWRGEFHNRKKNGELYWELAGISPIFDADGQITHFLALKEDITERKRAEERIREQAALLDKASDAIWVMDLNGCISYWNKGAERLYGWTAAEAIGKTPLDLLFKGVMTPQLQKCIKSVEERGEWLGELEEFTKDGNSVIIEGRSNVIRDEQGGRKGVLIINTDITERKKLEAQFLRAQRMESIGTLAGGIAHDLNNVLSPLMMSLQLLKDKISDPEIHELLEVMEGNVQRGANLLKQVLTFGRGIQGQKAPVQPGRMVREMGQIIQESFPKSIQFELRVPSDLRSIIGDSTQIHQVLLNLCVNARDAMLDGGKLTIEAANVDLDENRSAIDPEAEAGPYVIITVTDTGMGMPKEVVNHIFEPFFTTKEAGKGTGLGLSTSMGIVKSHGGFITCYSEPGRGTAFNVYLPATVAPVPETEPTGLPLIPRGRDELVLLVDDEESIRWAAEKALTHFGYRVLLASNGAEAVSLYASRQREIAAVVTDMSMPVMDGSTAIAELKAINPGVRIIASSGLSVSSAADTTHFISKPYAADVLLRALYEVLNEPPPPQDSTGAK